MTEEAAELRAPDGTFQMAKDLQAHVLGSDRSHRYIYAAMGQAVGPDRETWSREVYIQLRERGGSSLNWRFTVTNAELVTEMVAEQWQQNGRERTESEVPSLASMLRQITLARRIQPRLKRPYDVKS